ncbi:MAG TPA: ATP-binding protein, partial [Chitinophagaceae bacterium]|nr:ATP-binding protein [Chitinophagaceae bacterium]
MKVIDKILNDLEDSISSNQYIRIENENVELKDNSHSGGSWDKLMESVCAFLNTDSGIIIIGVNEDIKNRKYTLKGFNFDNENALKAYVNKITDENNHR